MTHLRDKGVPSSPRGAVLTPAYSTKSMWKIKMKIMITIAKKKIHILWICLSYVCQQYVYDSQIFETYYKKAQ